MKLRRINDSFIFPFAFSNKKILNFLDSDLLFNLILISLKISYSLYNKGIIGKLLFFESIQNM